MSIRFIIIIYIKKLKNINIFFAVHFLTKLIYKGFVIERKPAA